MFKHYSEELYLALRKHKKPYPFQIDIAEHPNGISLRVYEQQIMQYNDRQREEIMAYLQLLRKTAQQLQVNCAIVGVKGAPKV